MSLSGEVVQLSVYKNVLTPQNELTIYIKIFKVSAPFKSYDTFYGEKTGYFTSGMPYGKIPGGNLLRYPDGDPLLGDPAN